MIIKTNFKTRITLESFNSSKLNFTSQKIYTFLQTKQINLIKLISLPTKKRIYCVLRSPHVDKKSREHFEICIYKKFLDIYHNLELPISEFLLEMKLSSEVSYRIF